MLTDIDDVSLGEIAEDRVHHGFVRIVQEVLTDPSVKPLPVRCSAHRAKENTRSPEAKMEKEKRQETHSTHTQKWTIGEHVTGTDQSYAS